MRRNRTATAWTGSFPALFLALFGAGCVATPPDAARVDFQPRDLTPVTWLAPSKHVPVDIARDGVAKAVVFLANPLGQEIVKPVAKGQRPSTFFQMYHQLIGTVELATGAKLERVVESPPADQPAIVIGDSEETRRAGIDASGLPPEGFVVKTAPNRVYLVGSTRGGDGTAWAMADFLERFVGVRWYWPAEYGGRSVSHNPSLVVPPAHYRDQPVFRFRTMYQDWYFLQARSFDPQLLPMAPGVLPTGTETLWMGDHFRLMRQGNSWPYEFVMHGARIYEFVQDVPKTNETLFALRADGSRNFETLCYSAPDTLACYIDNLERAWDRGGKGVFIGGIRPTSVTIWMPLDLGGNSLVAACHCPACRETLARGGEAVLMGRFVQQVCEAVKRRWPGKMVVYVPWAAPQCPEELTFPDNLVVNSLNLYVMGLLGQPSLHREHVGNLRAWSRKCGRPVNMWIDFASPGDWTYGPVQFPNVVRDFYSSNRGQLDGGMVLTYGGACFVTAAPTYYVWNRALWNPDLDVDATLDELCKRLFGAGAVQARELLSIECDRWQSTALSRPLRVGEHRIPPKLFREIWPPDVVARMKALRDGALTAIERTGDEAARKSFLYWTWSFDAFVEYADTIDRVFTQDAGKPAAEVTPAASPAAGGNADAETRFHGGSAETNRVRIANVSRTDGPGTGQSDVRFDLSGGVSWRVKWTEPATNNVTGSDWPIESWSAAWVFVKYRLPGREKEGFSHATLSTQVADHGVPAGTTLAVGTSGHGEKGVGAFIHRNEVGHGSLNLKDVKLRWLHGVDGVTNPTAADLRVVAIDMVYVPRGAFRVGAGGTERGSLTDGAWTDGGAIPFLVDANWSGPLAEGSNARRIGQEPGRLWGTSEDGGSTIGPYGGICNAFPTGYESFYCMRYEVTRGQFTDFLNMISMEAYDSTTAGDRDHAGGHYTAAGRYALSGLWPNLQSARPYQACNLLSWWDGAKFAAWAGLRPMTELEYEKACRGPRRPVADEFAWGSTGIASEPYTMVHEGLADEHTVGPSPVQKPEHERAGDIIRQTRGNANYDLTIPDFYGGPARGGVSAVPGCPMRPGVFATADSGRVEAGASYWGIMELSGNAREPVVTLANGKGRAFQGSHGAGTLELPADWPEAKYRAGQASGENDGVGSGVRGGSFADLHFDLRTSDRRDAASRGRAATFGGGGRPDEDGMRAVRTAPEAPAVSLPGTAALRFERQMPRLSRPVRVDGALDEWSGRASLIRGALQQVYPLFSRHPVAGRAIWNGPEDLSVKAWWGFDGEAICVAAEVVDDRHFNVQTNDMIWNGDALQVGLILTNGVEWNMGLALTANGVVFHSWSGKGGALSAAAGRAVVRDNPAGITRYELRLPLTALGLEPDAEFGFNIAFMDDDDGSGQRYWLQLAPGLVGRDPKTPPAAQLYPRFVMAIDLGEPDL